MQVLILAAGYGTRLYPLTINTPKPLLPCNGKPIINYLLDKVRNFSGLNNIIVITNARFYEIFQSWAKGNKSFPVTLQVLNDKTTSPEDRLGAMGDISFALKEYGIHEDLLVMGGDNLFDYTLDEYVSFAQKKSANATIGLYDVEDIKSAKNFGIVQLDGKNRIISFEEKPQLPKSTLIAMCLYYLPRESLHFVSDYLRDSQKADTTGDYIHWLSVRDYVYGFKFNGKWYDIGSLEAYQEAQEAFKSY